MDQIPQRKQHCPSHNNDVLVKVCPRQWVAVCGSERLRAWAAASRFVYMAPAGLLFQCPAHGTRPALSKTVKIASSKDTQTFFIWTCHHVLLRGYCVIERTFSYYVDLIKIEKYCNSFDIDIQCRVLEPDCNKERLCSYLQKERFLLIS